jgi:copper(I)-binding protein
VKAQASIARRIGIGLVAVGATMLTGACAAGQLAATSLETPAIDGTTGHVGQMQLHAVAIVAPSGPCVLPGADAALTFVVVNNGRSSDSLTGVSSPRFAASAAVSSAADLASYASADAGTGTCSPASGSAAATPAPSATPAQTLPSAAGPQTVPPGQLLQLGVYGAGTNGPGVPTEPIVLLRQLQGGPLYPGQTIPVTFSFASAGKVTLHVPVQVSQAPNISIVPSVVNSATEPVGEAR